MTALILIVDDLLPNVKLLEAKLQAEYYDVISGMDGFEAIQQAKENHPDIVLLDVMMPGMDGFEACRQLKSDPETSHIPVVMVTALSEPSDRIQGLQAGADDFLTKPIKEVQLLARVKSLVRVKQLTDELRLRDKTSAQIGEVTGINLQKLADVSGTKVLLVDDDVVQSKNIAESLQSDGLIVTVNGDGEAAVKLAHSSEFDLIVVSTQLMLMDGLRLCSHLRSSEETRHLPQLILVDEDDEHSLIKGLEMGVNDYLISPLDLNELVCRVRSNIRRKKYQDALRSSYKQSMNMAITDSLTGLYNRNYMNAHMNNLIERSFEKMRPMACLILDMDHFKSVNDTYGHDVGDEILKELAERIIEQTRGSDMVARFGGEEFVVLLPETSAKDAQFVANRIQEAVCGVPFKVTHEVGELTKSISIGLSMLHLAKGPGQDSAEELMKRADQALYQAKEGGRNQVIAFAGDDGMSVSMFAPSDAAQEEQAPQGVIPVNAGETATPSQAPAVVPAGQPQQQQPPVSPQPTVPVQQPTPVGQAVPPAAVPAVSPSISPPPPSQPVTAPQPPVQSSSSSPPQAPHAAQSAGHDTMPVSAPPVSSSPSAPPSSNNDSGSVSPAQSSSAVQPHAGQTGPSHTSQAAMPPASPNPAPSIPGSGSMQAPSPGQSVAPAASQPPAVQSAQHTATPNHVASTTQTPAAIPPSPKPQAPSQQVSSVNMPPAGQTATPNTIAGGQAMPEPVSPPGQYQAKAQENGSGNGTAANPFLNPQTSGPQTSGSQTSGPQTTGVSAPSSSSSSVAPSSASPLSGASSNSMQKSVPSTVVGGIEASPHQQGQHASVSGGQDSVSSSVESASQEPSRTPGDNQQDSTVTGAYSSGSTSQ